MTAWGPGAVEPTHRIRLASVHPLKRCIRSIQRLYKSPGIARALGYAAGRPHECEAAAFISLNEHGK
jgi:hypothetical protein